MLELEYSFTIETGPSYYSEQTDECFCSTDDVEYKYEINQKQILEGLISYYSLENKPKEIQVRSILKFLEVDIDESEISLSLKNKDTTLEVINDLLNNLEEFVDEDIEDYLKDYYESDARYEWQRKGY